MTTRTILLASCILFLSNSAIAQLSRKEKKIVSQVKKNNEEAEMLLKELVNLNSGTMNFDGVQTIAERLIPQFESIGFDTEWVPGEAWNRAGHLVAKHFGDPAKPKILIIGHLDTVFEPDNPYQEYRMENDSIMFGPGIVDMKGGDIIALYALRALQEQGLLDDLNIWIVYTGDEEKSGSPLNFSKQAIVEAAEWADIALGFENGDSNPHTAVVSRRGSTGWTLEVEGQPAHSSQIFSEKVGAGAIYETARILNEFYNQLREEEFLTFNPGVVLGGTTANYESGDDGGEATGKSNVVAQTTIVRGDIRAVSLDQLERAKNKMEEIASKSLPGTNAKITWGAGGYPPLAPSNGNTQLLTKYSEVSFDLGYGHVEAVAPINAGAADISFTSGLVDMAMDGIGLAGGDDHTINEFGNLNWLPRLTERAAILIHRISNN